MNDDTFKMPEREEIQVVENPGLYLNLGPFIIGNAILDNRRINLSDSERTGHLEKRPNA